MVMPGVHVAVPVPVQVPPMLVPPFGGVQSVPEQQTLGDCDVSHVSPGAQVPIESHMHPLVPATQVYVRPLPGPEPVPQTFGIPGAAAVPQPQQAGATHEPQCRTLPQPSDMSPQFAPAVAQSVGVQGGHTLGIATPVVGSGPPQML